MTNPEPPATQNDADAKPPPPKPGLWRGWIRPLLTVILVVTALRSSLVDWNDVPTGSMVPTVAVGDRIVVNKLAYGFNLPFNGPVVAVPLTGISFDNPLDFLPGFYYSAPRVNHIVTFWKPGGFHEPAYQKLVDFGLPEDRARQQATVTDGGIRMVKRIVAGPGDTLELRRETRKFDGRPFDLSVLVLNGEEATYEKVGPYVLAETINGQTRLVQYVRNDPQEMRRRNGILDPRLAGFGPFTVPDGQYLMVGDNRDNSQDGRFFGTVPLKQVTGKAKFVAVSFGDHYLDPNWSRFFHPFDSDIP
jgi:signal peptidase I